jgi:cell division protein FtsI (penicillin-binding protein 3)
VVAAVPGATVQLTIDRTIHYRRRCARRRGGRQPGDVGCRSCSTSDRRCAREASAPGYDPNLPDPRHGARNRAVTDAYEIGSVMKVFTVAAALDAGVTRPDEHWDVESGSWQAPGKRITDVHHDPELTTAGIIKRSSNVGAVKIALRLGRDRVHAGLVRFGPPGDRIERPANGAASARPAPGATSSWSGGYGYGYPYPADRGGMAAIGNGGAPRAAGVASVTRRRHGRGCRCPSRARRSREAAAMVRCWPVFDGAGTAGRARPRRSGSRLPRGGKTGTAHKYDPATGRYALHHYLSSFAGLVPIADPRLAIVVVVDDPLGGDYFGGKVAGPVFGQIASASLQYLGVPGDAPIEEPKVKGARPARAAAAPDEDEVDPAAELADPADLTPERSDAIVVPDFRGLGAARALAEASRQGVAIELHGSGRCARQSVAPGRRAGRAAVVLELE